MNLLNQLLPVIRNFSSLGRNRLLALAGIGQAEVRAMAALRDYNRQEAPQA